MKNWKTTLCGAITAGASIISANPQLCPKHPWVIAVSQWVVGGGLVTLGLVSKDFNNHSTTDEVCQATEKKRQDDIKAINS